MKRETVSLLVLVFLALLLTASLGNEMVVSTGSSPLSYWAFLPLVSKENLTPNRVFLPLVCK